MVDAGILLFDRDHSLFILDFPARNARVLSAVKAGPQATVAGQIPEFVEVPFSHAQAPSTIAPGRRSASLGEAGLQVRLEICLHD